MKGKSLQQRGKAPSPKRTTGGTTVRLGVTKAKNTGSNKR